MEEVEITKGPVKCATLQQAINFATSFRPNSQETIIQNLIKLLNLKTGAEYKSTSVAGWLKENDDHGGKDLKPIFDDESFEKLVTGYADNNMIKLLFDKEFVEQLFTKLNLPKIGSKEDGIRFKLLELYRHPSKEYQQYQYLIDFGLQNPSIISGKSKIELDEDQKTINIQLRNKNRSCQQNEDGIFEEII